MKLHKKGSLHPAVWILVWAGASLLNDKLDAYLTINVAFLLLVSNVMTIVNTRMWDKESK